MSGSDSKQNLGPGPAAVLQAMESSVALLRWGLLVLVAVYLGSGITVVGPNETAFILRLGKLQPTLHGPGLLLALPPPFDEVVKVPTRSVQELHLDAWDSSGSDWGTLSPVADGYTLTGDANIIRAKFSVRYEVSDPAAYMLTVKNQQALLEAILYQAATDVIARMNVDDVLASGLETLRTQALNVAQAQIDRLGLGVRLLAFEVNEIIPARQVLPAFEDVVSARVESRTIVEVAQSYRASEMPKAESDAYRIKQAANAYAANLVAKATGEASAFEAIDRQYRLAPELMRARLYADAMETILPNLRSAKIVGPAGGRLNLFLQPGADAPPPSTPPSDTREE